MVLFGCSHRYNTLVSPLRLGRETKKEATRNRGNGQKESSCTRIILHCWDRKTGFELQRPLPCTPTTLSEPKPP